MTAKRWICIFLSVTLLLLVVTGIVVAYIDPFFHYHKPGDSFFYTLDNARSQNDGILKHFDYDAIISGSSITENFKTSEFDALFDVSSVKVSSSGASFKEIDSYIRTAIASGHSLKAVVRCLDMNFFFDDKDRLREDMGEYPTYLYDRNPFNDIKYLYNRDVLIRCMYMTKLKLVDKKTGITSFDDYGNWSAEFEGRYGARYILSGHEQFKKPVESHTLTQEEKKNVIENITQNVIETAKANPETQFYIYISPYSAIWWGEQVQEGNLERNIEAEKCVIELLLECDNINLYSFNTHYDITTDMDNYRDKLHYGEWINSDILQYMKNGEGKLTKDNYIDYLIEEKIYYETFDYNSLF